MRTIGILIIIGVQMLQGCKNNNSAAKAKWGDGDANGCNMQELQNRSTALQSKLAEVRSRQSQPQNQPQNQPAGDSECWNVESMRSQRDAIAIQMSASTLPQQDDPSGEEQKKRQEMMESLSARIKVCESQNNGSPNGASTEESKRIEAELADVSAKMKSCTTCPADSDWSVFDNGCVCRTKNKLVRAGQSCDGNINDTNSKNCPADSTWNDTFKSCVCTASQAMIGPDQTCSDSSINACGPDWKPGYVTNEKGECKYNLRYDCPQKGFERGADGRCYNRTACPQGQVRSGSGQCSDSSAYNKYKSEIPANGECAYDQYRIGNYFCINVAYYEDCLGSGGQLFMDKTCRIQNSNPQACQAKGGKLYQGNVCIYGQ